jgi:hypothetical protein
MDMARLEPGCQRGLASPASQREGTWKRGHRQQGGHQQRWGGGSMEGSMGGLRRKEGGLPGRGRRAGTRSSREGTEGG